MFRFLDLSGVGNSGKSAVVDLLKEVKQICVSDTFFEFDLLRIHGGVLDLRNALVENWSPIRSNEAIKVFRKRIQSMGVNPKFYQLSKLLYSSSQRYDSHFHGKFSVAAFDFIDSLILDSYQAYWPYDSVDKNIYIRFIEKILSRLGFSGIKNSNIHLVDGDGFDLKVNCFMQKIYSHVAGQEDKWVTLNNGFEPYNPKPFFSMLPNSKQVVILRDPRDIFVSGNPSKTASAADRRLLSGYQNKTNFSFLGSNIDVFVNRVRLYHRNLMSTSHPQVLKVRFEDMCLNYEKTIATIFDFLEIDKGFHIRKKQVFKPEISGANVGLWKHYSLQDEIRFIESSLPDLLYTS